MEKLSGKKSKSSVGDKDLDEREQRAAELRKQYEIKLEQKVGPRITKADKLNDRKSLRRYDLNIPYVISHVLKQLFL